MLFSDIIDDFYCVNEYPALNYLIKKYAVSRPFENCKVLVATPIFRNTLVQYLALFVAGAKLYVGYATGTNGATMPSDLNVLNLLKEHGVQIVTDEYIKNNNLSKTFDLILDCAGQFSFCSPKIGAVELTLSGVQFYKNVEYPVYVADSGIVKRIETILGTGEGYFRGLKKFGYSEFENKKLLVFGSGKVGSGCALYGVRYGMCVTVVTDLNNSAQNFIKVLENNNVHILDFNNTAVINAIKNCDYLVMATGIKNALSKVAAKVLLESNNVIAANMGVEDEFGESVPKNRVLNEKSPLNFSLEEPTHLKYIDASLALHVALGERLLLAKPFMGTMPPPQELEQELLNVSIQNGAIGSEICEILL